MLTCACQQLVIALLCCSQSSLSASEVCGSSVLCLLRGEESHALLLATRSALWLQDTHASRIEHLAPCSGWLPTRLSLPTLIYAHTIQQQVQITPCTAHINISRGRHWLTFQASMPAAHLCPCLPQGGPDKERPGQIPCPECTQWAVPGAPSRALCSARRQGLCSCCGELGCMHTLLGCEHSWTELFAHPGLKWLS